MDSADYGTPITPIEEQSSNTKKIILIVVAVVLGLCCCFLVFGLLLYFVLGDMILEALDIAALIRQLPMLL